MRGLVPLMPVLLDSVHRLLPEHEPLPEQPTVRLQLRILQRLHQRQLPAMSLLLPELLLADCLPRLFSCALPNYERDDVLVHARLLRQRRISCLPGLFSNLQVVF